MEITTRLFSARKRKKMKKKSVFYRWFYSRGFRILYKLFCILPMKQNKVLFASDSRTSMSGNFKFVYDEMKSRNLDYEYRFMLKKNISLRKRYIEIIRLAFDLATSRIIFLDDFYPMVYPLRIRKKAELIQLWHAVGAFKTFGYSRVGKPGGPSPESRNHRNYTKAIVSSQEVAKHYAEGFGIPLERVVATGIPRTDVFFDEEYKKKIVAELYEKYPFLAEKKVILFAPTFRGYGQSTAHYPFNELDLDKLYDALKDEYVFIFKMHPFVKKKWKIKKEHQDFFYDMSKSREINDLLFVTDLLITDYSSVCFEHALLKKPMLFFSFDMEEYVAERDFYYEYESFIPGPLVRTTDQIIEKIQSHDYELEKLESFIQRFFNHTDGHSSKRVVDQLVLGKIADVKQKERG